MRRDINVHLVLLGEPDPGKIVRFNGKELKYLNPDERSSGALIKKALQKDALEYESSSTPGVWIRKADLQQLLEEFAEKERSIYYLREDGEDIRGIAPKLDDSVFILGDHMGVTEEKESIIENFATKTLNIGPISLHSDHCITIILNEIDRATE